MKSLIVLAALSLSLAGAAEARGPVDARQQRQQRSIARGIASGTIQPREVIALERQQARIDRLQQRARRDGVVGPAERARLGRALNRSARHIARAKRNQR